MVMTMVMVNIMALVRVMALVIVMVIVMVNIMAIIIINGLNTKFEDVCFFPFHFSTYIGHFGHFYYPSGHGHVPSQRTHRTIGHKLAIFHFLAKQISG